LHRGVSGHVEICQCVVRDKQPLKAIPADMSNFRFIKIRIGYQRIVHTQSRKASTGPHKTFDWARVPGVAGINRTAWRYFMKLRLRTHHWATKFLTTTRCCCKFKH